MKRLHITKEVQFEIDASTLPDADILAEATRRGLIPKPIHYEPMEIPEDEKWTSTTIHIPNMLLSWLRTAAISRAHDRGYGRPSVSEIAVEVLLRHVDEFHEMPTNTDSPI